MNRLSYNILAALLLAFFVIGCTPKKVEQANVLLIMADDLGFSDLGCYGGEIKTPNLDKLASGGLRFTQMNNCGRCWPSRATLLSGFYPQQIGRDNAPGILGGGRGVRPDWAELLPEYLKDAGYRSYHSGKWHIDGMPLENGFDHSYYLGDQGRFFSPLTHYENDIKLPPVERGTGYYGTIEIADKAIEQLKEHNSKYSDKPFFSYVAFTAPHFPLHALPEDIKAIGDRYAPGWEQLRNKRWERIKEMGIVNGELSDVEPQIGPPYHFPEALEILGDGEVNRPVLWETLSQEQKQFQQDKMTIHAAMVERMDKEIGRIISQLKAMNALENTLVLFLSDNGASAEIMVRDDGHDPKAVPGSASTYLCLGPGWSNMCNTPFRRHKTWVHEGGTCTPFIAHWPNGFESRGELRQTNGHIIDVVPTILDLAGISIDSIGKVSLPGHSLRPVFKEERDDERPVWFYHEGNRALRVGEWKLVAANNEPWELYNLLTDRTESNNLAPGNADKVIEMEKQWTEILTEFREVAPQKSIEKEIIANKWQSLQTSDEGGLLGERVNLWRNNRLWNIAESGYLIDGFETRPGIHPWQGEHLGKWLHAATLAYNVSGDEKLKKKLDEMVESLITTQLPNGYLGTYADEVTFMSMPENVSIKTVFDDVAEQKKSDSKTKKKPRGGWDTWTHRYNLYGLLTYEKYFPNQRVIDACKKMGDLLIEYYGEGKYDLTKYGTRQGISATTLLESIVMLYERTSDKKYLDFAEHIVEVSEKNPKLRLMGTMLEKGSVVYPGDGKGYQLMANLLGYLRLYRSTYNEKYLQTVLNGWDEIYTKHLLVTGGPWTRQMPYNDNKECFAHSDAFHPEEILVEGCCDATWIQLNIHLFEFTGDAKYFNEAEVTLINSVYGHQYSDGIEWCYYTAPNEIPLKYEPRIHCCGSSEPRGLEMYSSHLAGEINKNLSINTLFPSTIKLSKQFGGGTIKVEGNFPLESSAKIHLNTKTEKNFTLEFRLPANTALESVSVSGEETISKTNDRGFIEINRKWKKGDIVAVELDYQLEAHLQDGEEGGKWVAFTYGPFALAQKITEMPDEEPFTSFGSKEPSEYLKMISKSADSETEFFINGTDISLIPYYQTGSKQSGPRTYFRL